MTGRDLKTTNQTSHILVILQNKIDLVKRLWPAGGAPSMQEPHFYLGSGIHLNADWLIAICYYCMYVSK